MTQRNTTCAILFYAIKYYNQSSSDNDVDNLGDDAHADTYH